MLHRHSAIASPIFLIIPPMPMARTKTTDVTARERASMTSVTKFGILILKTLRARFECTSCKFWVNDWKTLLG
ncbi:hypothetical protein BXZ70DRAFT_748714 [Cristinia sonorae]|uniref:Uncharacterized protein n=1 Tax=Cristinia sonorae TaxID=1940300 RepID=A0A8K0UDU5_9AGAR|nr:hypothetical protein BXZ70DRAFT_748714 [Cristinia sonorae]